ncbi:MAG: hypothetical protein KDA87_06150 [Planctomycetales bacterium]|nr:hypothetical protein [Planctomycetales bacterium]
MAANERQDELDERNLSTPADSSAGEEDVDEAFDYVQKLIARMNSKNGETPSSPTPAAKPKTAATKPAAPKPAAPKPTAQSTAAIIANVPHAPDSQGDDGSQTICVDVAPATTGTSSPGTPAVKLPVEEPVEAVAAVEPTTEQSSRRSFTKSVPDSADDLKRLREAANLTTRDALYYFNCKASILRCYTCLIIMFAMLATSLLLTIVSQKTSLLASGASIATLAVSGAFYGYYVILMTRILRSK